MTTDNHDMNLMVTVSAAEWGALRKRVVFLEAVAVQLLRDGQNIREWFGAADLAALRLPDLPTAKNAITRLAREQEWTMRPVPCQGGTRHVYHFSALPRRAFEALIDRILKAPPDGSERIGNERDQVPTRSKRATRRKAPIFTSGATPAWVLPLLRIIRTSGVNVAQALDKLPHALPTGISCPSREEAIEVLTNMGLVRVS